MNSERVMRANPGPASEHGPGIDERRSNEDDIPLDPDDESVVERDLEEAAPEHTEDDSSGAR